ncbi:MAG: hypothetical protein WCV85_00540 [Patescibacteria group bacterium]|jgi:hypothetical protein
MDLLTAFGIVAVLTMLFTYAMERRHPNWVLGFAAACLASGIYGLLTQAWLLGSVEIFWSGIALHRWWKIYQIHKRVQEMKKLPE